jgi:hypothetical protein
MENTLEGERKTVTALFADIRTSPASRAYHACLPMRARQSVFTLCWILRVGFISSCPSIAGSLDLIFASTQHRSRVKLRAELPMSTLVPSPCTYIGDTSSAFLNRRRTARHCVESRVL